MRKKLLLILTQKQPSPSILCSNPEYRDIYAHPARVSRQTNSLRIHVFSHDSNPRFDPPTNKVSEFRALELVRDGKALPLDTKSIQMKPPIGEKADQRNFSAGHEDWGVVHSSYLGKGEVLRISTLQIRTFEVESMVP